MISRLFFLLAIFFTLYGFMDPSGFLPAGVCLLISIVTKPEKKSSKGFIGAFFRTLGETDCPYCKEVIKKDAVKCKHCGSILPSSGSTESDISD